MRATIPSRDRALQLDGCLRSLDACATEPLNVLVSWSASSPRHEAAYRELAALHPRVTFLRRRDLEAETRFWLGCCKHALLLVDDTIFVRPFSPAVIAHALDAGINLLGFSLRLGKNTTHCYPMHRAQLVPAIHDAIPVMPTALLENPGMMAWRWPGADGDFGYPLEQSSSIYRSADVLLALVGSTFTVPNEMEDALASRAALFTTLRPWLASYETSVAFSNPCNRVQTTHANRAGSRPEHSAEALLSDWERGYRLVIEAYQGHVPTGAHEEMPIVLERRP